MKAHTTRARALRALAIAGLLASLAVPVAATAMLPRADPPAPVRPANAAAYVPDAFAGALVQTAGASDATAPSIVREIRTVNHDGGQSLAIVLAACALGITLVGSGYALVRVSRIQHDLVGSPS